MRARWTPTAKLLELAGPRDSTGQRAVQVGPVGVEQCLVQVQVRLHQAGQDRVAGAFDHCRGGTDVNRTLIARLVGDLPRHVVVM
jgi:hypothetical protein